jgi:hypothetical protein
MVVVVVALFLLVCWGKMTSSIPSLGEQYIVRRAEGLMMGVRCTQDVELENATPRHTSLTIFR